MKIEVKIKLDTVEKVKAFVQKVTEKFPYNDVDVMSSQNHRYCVDAKSIMGVFSLDLSQELTVALVNAEDSEKEAFELAMNEFRV